MRQTDSLLTVRDLTVELSSNGTLTPLVRGITFEVRAGETVALVGQTGSGKSLTARAIMRLLDPPLRIAGGSVILEGRELLALSKREMRTVRGREIAMVFQNPQASLNPMLRVGSQLTETIVLQQGSSRDEAQKIAHDLLSELQLEDPAHVMRSYPHQLSGGMCQRVMIGLAILTKPKLLIADEATTALDTITQAHILRLLQSLKGSFVSSLLLITHDLRIVRKMADRVAILHKGVLREFADTPKVFTHPADSYTRELVQLARSREG